MTALQRLQRGLNQLYEELAGLSYELQLHADTLNSSDAQLVRAIADELSAADDQLGGLLFDLDHMVKKESA